MLRLDYIFSNWIIIWFVLYFIGIMPYNPTFILILALCLVIFETVYMWYLGANAYNMKKYIIINIMLKNIPLLLLWSQNRLSIKAGDVYFTIVLFIIYNIYLQLNGQNIVTYYDILHKPYYKNIDDPEQKTLFSNTYDYMYNLIQKHQILT